MSGFESTQLLRYPDDKPVLPPCDRCGSEVKATWLDLTKFGDQGRRLLCSEAWCPIPGCVDETGSRTPFDPTPADLRRRAEGIQARLMAVFD